MKGFFFLLISLITALRSVSAQSILPSELTLSEMESVKAYVVGDQHDQLYLSVPWGNSVLDGQMMGQKEDKPILLWLYFGGPLGNC
ncbi:hypothetical protein Rhal01_00502 [Rubritalea halochordaticola]|uniref:Uncharacterized protein n=1 Tax=Rubritalea halochordaticola TaxID=714537 RepID=A0ABP9UZ72_9BACT